MTTHHHERARLAVQSTRRRRRAGLGVLLAVGLVAAGCGDDSSDSQPTTTGGSGATTTAAAGATTTAAPTDDFCNADRAGGEITFSAFLMTRSFDPVISTGSGTTGSVDMALIYDMLVRWNDETRTFEPKLAKSIDHNADFTEWTLGLRPEAKFGNGDPVDAEAVKGSIERHTNPNNFSTVFVDAQVIKEIEVKDPYTLVFHMTAPFGTFPFFLSDVAGLVVNPKVFAAGRDEATGLDPKGAGAGPYEVTRFAPGEEIIYEKKADWWGDDVFGPVCIDRIREIDIPTDTATLDALKLGEIDIELERSPKTIAEIKKEGFGHFFELSHAGSIMMIYSGDPAKITSDPRIRQALQYAIDTKAYDERVNNGTGRPTSSIMDAESPVAPDIKGLPFDSAKAKALVAEVKAEGWDGKIELIQGNINTEPGITLQGMFEAVGFDVDLVDLPSNENIARIYVNQSYELGLGGSSLHDSSPIITLERFWGPTNRYTGFRDPAFVAALVKVRAAATDAQMKAALTELQTIWNEQVPSVLLSTAEQGMAWNDNVHGMYFTHNGVGFFDKAWVE